MKNILLVEDDAFLVDIYKKILEQNGYEITVAMDGDQCMASLNEKIPELMLLDIVLPSIDGWELLRKIRKIKKYDTMKVIILSNLGQKEEVEKGIKLGAIKFLIKAHHSPSEVVEEVKKIL